MDRNEVRLVRKYSGYAVEQTENWQGYSTDKRGVMLAHDLFHHRLGENGYSWQELRAHGAIQFFHKGLKPDQEVIDSALKNGGWETLELSPIVHEIPDVFRDWYSQLDFGGIDLEPVLHLIMDGFMWAASSGYTLDAYLKVRNHDFNKDFIEHQGDLMVNLVTGEVERLKRIDWVIVTPPVQRYERYA